MLDLITTQAWQIQVLMFETVFSAAIGLVLIRRGFQRTLTTMTFFLLWNVALFTLLITGGNASWQHLVVGAVYLFDTFVVISMGIRRVKTEPATGNSDLWFITLYASGILALLITG